MPSPTTTQIRELKAREVYLLEQLKAAKEREADLIKRLAAMQRAQGKSK